jgi:hypothetical protein
MADSTLAALMSDLVKYRPMLEQMYKRWVEEQQEPADDPKSSSTDVEITTVAKISVPP